MIIRTALIALGLLLCLLAGCASYPVRGKVVGAEFNTATFVDFDDPRLAQPGVANVEVSFIRDPDSLSREVIATGLSGPGGNFEIDLDTFGAGWLQEQWLLRAAGAGLGPVEAMLNLPGGGEDKRLLILIGPGSPYAPSSPSYEDEDLFEEYERFR